MAVLLVIIAMVAALLMSGNLALLAAALTGFAAVLSALALVIARLRH